MSKPPNLGPVFRDMSVPKPSVEKSPPTAQATTGDTPAQTAAGTTVDTTHKGATNGIENTPHSDTTDILLFFLAIFISPLAVYLKIGGGIDVVLNFILWFFLWIPGVFHAWWIIAFGKPTRNYEY